MKKKYLIFILFLLIIGTWGSCKKDFLDVKPTGSLSIDVLSTSYQGVDALLIGAYHFLHGQGAGIADGWGSAFSNWMYGDVRGLIANKGSNATDQPNAVPLQNFNESSTNAYLDEAWRVLYGAINRCNQTILAANKALEGSYITQDQATSLILQAKGLRGWYHFQAARMWGTKVPYVDETVDGLNVKNDADITDQIIADLTAGTTLPNNMGAIGRFNGTVCKVLLGKALMQLKHDYAGALTKLNEAKSGTKPDGSSIGLAATYGEIFDIKNRNGLESIYTTQYSVNDGSGGINGGEGEILNYPYGDGKPGTCCGFFAPTQEFVNSFRTSTGLPLLDNSYNTGANQVKNDWALLSSDPFTPDAGPVDPRLDWAVGRRGIPYWDWGIMTGSDWIRDKTNAGPYVTKKQVYKKSDVGTYTEVGNWTSGWTANGYRLIRYADLLLMIAECQIETNDLPGARTNINLVRARASNPAGFVMNGAVPAANYVINQYPSSGAPFDNQTNARLALRMERKLELGMEGHRYFDLNRWGNTVTELNRALTYEKTMPWGSTCYVGATVGPEDINYPIPQNQIDLSNGNIVQNEQHK